MIHELRQYVAVPGKGALLLKRFREDTFSLFQNLSINMTQFWTASDDPDVMYYIVEWSDREAMEQAWLAFRDDPEWQVIKDNAEQDGPLVQSIESTPLDPLKL